MDQCWNMRSDLRPTFKEVVERLEGECREEVVARTMLPNVNKSGGGLVSSRQDLEKLDLIKKELEVGAKRQQGEIEVERKKAQDRLRKRMVERRKTLQEEKKSGEIGLEDKEDFGELRALLLASPKDRDLLAHLTTAMHKYKKE